MNRARIDLLVLFVISAILLLWNLGTGSLLSWDEGLYGEVSREILKTGNWIDLHWAGQPWSDKPPLYMWVTALFYMIFGVSEFSVRLFAALCGVGTVLVTYLFANKLYSRKAALASSLILLSTWHFIWTARVGMLDSTLTFFIVLSLFLFKLGEEKKICLFFSAAAFACAFLTKGLGSLIIPVILALYLILTGNYKILKEPALISGAIVAFFILGWWHWLAFSHYGEGFISDYIVKHLFTRTTKAVEGHVGDIFTYIGVIPNKGRPWGGVGLALLPYLAWRIIARREKEHFLPVIWAGAVLVLFSMVKTKLHWYMIPVYPALSMMSGWGAERLFKKRTIPVISILAFISLSYLSIEKNIFDLDYSPAIKRIAVKVKKTVPEGQAVYLYDISDPGMQFYLGDVSENISGKEALSAFPRKEDQYILVNKGSVKDLADVHYSISLDGKDFILIRTESE
ncbi:MAG: glycosyltransferase family 39 protein [Candidatus Omnitrophota bacterium]|jgi:4-amino-4-deoxy-L-arabinose transferase-like glycosyltransferase